jgi:hypothetical protein
VRIAESLFEKEFVLWIDNIEAGIRSIAHDDGMPTEPHAYGITSLECGIATLAEGCFSVRGIGRCLKPRATHHAVCLATVTPEQCSIPSV